jgi:hypothetical protein
MPAPKANRLAGLVKTAADEISPTPPIRRGRGLEGVIGSTSEADSPSTSKQVDKSASTQTNKSANVQTDKLTDGIDQPARTVKSYRLRDDLVYKIDLLAATDRRKIYEVVEEALELYLLTRAAEHSRTDT